MDFTSRHDRNHLVQEPNQRPQNARLGLTAQTEKDEVVTRQHRVDDLRHDGVVEPDDAREQRRAWASRSIRLCRTSSLTLRRGTRPAATSFRSWPSVVGRETEEGITASYNGPPAKMWALSEFSQRGSGRPLVFAHRGGAGLRPENTMPAFDHGLSLGADGVELDVHLSRDGVVMVHHDDALDRTTDATGPLASRTADELAQVDAGYRFNRNLEPGQAEYPFRGQHIGIPRFRDVLARHRTRASDHRAQDAGAGAGAADSR